MAKFNKGDVSEGILAAAITARFRSKTKKIDASDVVSVIQNLNAAKSGIKGATTITNFKSPNANKAIVDTVVCKVNLADVNMSAFLKKTTYNDKAIKSLVTAACSFANGGNINKFADQLYNNNQKNFIEVNSEGLLNQTGTKVDLKVIVDGKQIGFGISLKAEDVKQFGQVGGSKWESMENLFKPLGINFSDKTKTTYTNLLSEKKIADALTLAYGEAFKQLKSLSKTNQKQLRNNIADFANFHATSGEKNVVLVQLTGGTATTYDFSILKSKLEGVQIDVEIASGKTDKLKGFAGSKNIPKINFTVPDLKGKQIPLLQLRMKLEGNRVDSKGKKLPLTVRNYIEKGLGIKKLIT